MKMRPEFHRPLGLGLVLLCLVSPSLRAQTSSRYAEAPAPTRHDSAIDFARTLVQAMMEESGTPGVSIAVGLDGEIVWSEGFGYADVEQRVPVWEQTKFRIGSVSKPLTAAALGLLYEQGRLDLDAPVQLYVPSFPEKRWPITARQLAGHLAGVRHYLGREFLSNRRYTTVLEGLQIFADDSLLFEPGTRYSYSSYGWNLISAVVEAAADVDFLTFMQQRVFDQLAMENTVADHTDSIIPHRTRFYQRTEDGRVVNAPFVDNSYKWAGGGFLSTPEDLLRFAFAHPYGGFLKPETVEMLWTSQRTADGEETGYGIGWRVTALEGRVVEVAHGGGSVGGTTFLLIYPEERAALAIVGNMTQAPTSAPAWLVLDAFLRPESLATAGRPGREASGTYACTASRGDAEVGTATLQLIAAPGGYWGGMTLKDGSHERIVFAAGGAQDAWLITVDGRGGLTSMKFDSVTASGGLTGRWARGGGGGAISCDAARQ